jgi:hypothetical protein
MVPITSFCFPANTDYSVIPCHEPASEDSPDNQLLFDVLSDDKPVFTSGHKALRAFKYGSNRDDVDRQTHMIDRHMVVSTVLMAHCPLPVLHGVSAFGTRLCFYRMHRDHEWEITQPSLIPYHPERVTGTGL